MYKIEKYYLIDWGGCFFAEEIYMTGEEAQIKNKDLISMQSTLRYVKANARKLNKKNKKIK